MMQNVEDDNFDSREEYPDASDDRRRLTKALSLVEKLKAKLEFEREVSKELASRNDQLKKSIAVETERNKSNANALADVTAKVYALLNYLETMPEDVPVDWKDGLQMKTADMKTVLLRHGREEDGEADDKLSHAGKTHIADDGSDTSMTAATTMPNIDVSSSIDLIQAKKSRRRASSVYISDGNGTSLVRHQRAASSPISVERTVAEETKVTMTML